MLTRLFLKAI